MTAPTQSLVSLTQRLIERPSVTPDDAGCQALLTDELKSLGFVVEELPFGEVSNFWATHGSGSPYLVFAGHTDVVPTGPPEQWTSDPFRPEIRDGLLYGRGSADMKGSLAAMLIASRAFVEANPDHAGTLAWLVTSDEEGDAVDGTVRVVAHLADQGIRPDYCVVGEPSSSAEVGDVIRIGRRGSLNGKLAVHGVQGHVAYPDQASNPIHAFSRCLAALVATEWDQGNAAFPPTSFQVSNLHAGTGATNVVPGELEVLFNFRYSTEQTAAGLKQRVAAVLDEHGVPHSLSWSLSGEPFLTADGPLIQAVRESICAVQGFEPEASTGGGTSDGRFIAPAGTEVVELGPVNATIHSIDECTPVADLARLAEMYRGIADRLLGVPLSGGV